MAARFQTTEPRVSKTGREKKESYASYGSTYEILPETQAPEPGGLKPEPVQTLKTEQLWLALVVLGVGALALRVILANRQSAYMDESSFILTGRYLIEKQAVYAGALNWTYGSFLWPLVAGTADIIGGLQLVRGVTAFCGLLMVLATVYASRRLAPASLSPRAAWLAALSAGLIMALMPTALGIGRFGTYDGLAGAAFMWGLALLIPGVKKAGSKFQLLAGAVLLFTAFLAKYLVAIYFPFVCLALLAYAWFGAGERKRQKLVQVGAFFVFPLGLACLAYFLFFQKELVNLLNFSTGYSDLRSNQPLREYLLERPEIWGLGLLALLGSFRAAGKGRLVGWGGLAILLLFQALSRADFDFWKHSIYLIFFLAPLAGLLLGPVFDRILTGAGGAKKQNGHRKGSAVFIPLLLLGGLAAISLYQSNKLVTFYPNYNPVLPAIQHATAGAGKVLTDDSALRYYLYPRIIPEKVTDPFFINFEGKNGLEGYRQAISSRYFDVIVLDGGISPQGSLLNTELGGVINQYYKLLQGEEGSPGVKIFQPRVGPVAASSPNPANSRSQLYFFDNGTREWGGIPEKGELQPGLQVSSSAEQTRESRNTLKFEVTPQVSLVGLKQTGKFKQLHAWVYIVPTDEQKAATPVGMVAFDADWQWHDDGFKQVIPPGKWVELNWQLDQPLAYKQLGFKFPEGARVVYLDQVEIS